MNRTAVIRDALLKKGVDGVVISDLGNVRYLSGFTGSSGCIILAGREKVFITDFRYQEQAHLETRGFDILIEKGDRAELVIGKAKALGISVLGFESTVSYAFYRSLLRKGLKVKAVSNIVEEVRRIKDGLELKHIKIAVERAEKAFEAIRPCLKIGASERRIAALLEENLINIGCNKLPFDIIVASGRNSAMPHARPTDNRIKAGDFLVIDWGGESGGYFSDMTRTFLAAGRNISEKKKIYETVLTANLKAISTAAEGVHAREIDRAARDVIKNAGYGEFFGHGTGHGIGLEVHELPRISMSGREIVRKGMVFSIEPGIYVPGLGGVRIEDMVVAAKKGCTVLTGIPKKLEIIH